VKAHCYTPRLIRHSLPGSPYDSPLTRGLKKTILPNERIIKPDLWCLWVLDSKLNPNSTQLNIMSSKWPEGEDRRITPYRNSGVSMRVLLADDEKVYIESLAKILRRRGFDVVAVFDGPSAIDAASRAEFDVIVLDLRMPGMDGLATLEAIRRGDTLTPVLLLTGHADLERVTKALKGGAGDVLMKPCPVDALISAIEDASERKGFAKEVEDRQERE